MIAFRKPSRLLLALILLVTSLSACRRPSDEAQVQAAIEMAGQAVEAGTTSAVVTPLSNDFDGNGGEMDRRSLGNLVRLFALRGEHIGVALGPVTIEHHGSRMVASFTASLTSGGRVLPDQLGLYRIESAWRKESSSWRCYTASWKRSL